ncbi:MAG: hypothetical protein AAGB12_08065 [Pseudomonadota bacterium]
MKFFINIIGMMVILPAAVWARPVSYPGGITLMQMNDFDTSSIHMHYSPTANYSLGYKGEYWRNDDWHFQGVQINYLIKRWNKPASQANVYLKSGTGWAFDKDNKNNLAAFTGVSLDWEDRRFFTSYSNRFLEAGQITQFFTQNARVGIAPYMGDYGDLHTWLMLQIDHQPEKENALTTTFLARFFKGEYLVELGVTQDGDALMNFIIRY